MEVFGLFRVFRVFRGSKCLEIFGKVLIVQALIPTSGEQVSIGSEGGLRGRRDLEIKGICENGLVSSPERTM